MRRHHNRRTVLKATVGLAAATTGLATLGGTAAAHFPDGLDIDVKPGSARNPINPRSRGVTTVAVLWTDAFDPTTADVRYRFGPPEIVGNGGGAGPVRHHVEDVNGDGHDDLVLQFRTSEAGFEHGHDEAELRWYRNETREHGLSGRDAIETVGGGRR